MKGLAGGTATLVLLAAAVVAAGSADATAARTLYAYAKGAGTTAGCPATSVATAGCSFGETLKQAAAGDSVVLATPGSAADYVGNWTVGTTGTSPSKPVTITAAPGLAAQPTLNGNDGYSLGCTTTACTGSILTVGAGVSLVVRDVVFTRANATGRGGAIDVGDHSTGSTLTVSGSTFTRNTAADGGAIAASYGGTATVGISNSVFVDNVGLDEGGAIENGCGGISAAMTVDTSSFVGNAASSGGGAIANVENGTGTLVVRRSTFTQNAANNGGAINNAEEDSGTAVISQSTFADNSGLRGGAIANGDDGGTGTVSLLGSTFSRDTVSSVDGLSPKGPEIANGFVNDATPSTIVAAGNLFDGACAQQDGTWIDDGHNAGLDASCLKGGSGDLVSSAVGADLEQPAGNRGASTSTIAPTAGSPVIGLVPNGALAPHAPAAFRTLCARTDQTGYRTATGSTCNAGAVDLPAPLRPTLTVTGGAAVAAGSKHGLTGRTRPGATVVLSHGATRLASTKASTSGTFAFTRTLTASATFTVSADRQTTSLAVSVVRLSIGVAGTQPLRKGNHTVTGHAPARRAVALVRDGHVVARTTAGSKNTYSFTLNMTSTHRYAIQSDGQASSVLTVRIE